MNVFIEAVVLDGWKIEIDDVHDIANVKASSRDTSSDHDRGFASLEGTTADISQVKRGRGNFLQSIFSLTLGAIRVDGGGWQAHVEEVVINEVSGLLGLDEDEGARRWHGDQKIVESLLFGIALNPDNLHLSVE